MNGKGDTPRPISVPPETFAERWERTFGKPGTTQYNVTWGGQEFHVRTARRELTRMMQDRPADLCPFCHGEGRDPNHWKNACPECDSSGRRKEAD